MNANGTFAHPSVHPEYSEYSEYSKYSEYSETPPATEHEVTELLGSLSQDEAATLERLHARLGRAAEADGILDVAYRTLETPVGLLLLAATDRGLVRVAYAREDHDRVLAVLADRVSPRVVHAPRRLDRTAAEIEEYFTGDRTRFDVRLDFRLSRGFRREVLARLPDVAYGTTATYASLARAVGNPGAVRAVGSACANNPLPVVVPCHRIVRSDGTAGGYVGGPDAKQTLLDLEVTA